MHILPCPTCGSPRYRVGFTADGETVLHCDRCHVAWAGGRALRGWPTPLGWRFAGLVAGAVLWALVAVLSPSEGG